MPHGVEQIENYCHSRWQEEMKTNEIRITTGFALLKDIIHIYAPIYTLEEEPLSKLKESYSKLFEVIRKEKYSKVIIPSVGTGFHCYRHEDVAELVIKLLETFCNNNKDIDIIFSLYDEKTKSIYEQYL